MSTVSALIPAYNESDRIAETIRALRTVAGIDEIIVIDDGSADDTAECAENAGADVVLRQQHRGKGSALRAGYAIATGAILLLVDADLGSTASEADKLLHPVKSGSADMTIATFPVLPGKGGGAGLVVGLARRGIAELTGRRLAAPLSGQRAVTRTLLDEVGGFDEGWGAEIGLTVRALWNEFAVMEIPTTMTHRVTGRSLKDMLHRASQYIAARKVLRKLKRLRPSAAQGVPARR